MSLYTVLDAVADNVNRVLALIAIIQLVSFSIKRQWRNASIYLMTLLALLVVIYGWMMVDRRLFDFPYSTHSAFAASFCMLHAVYMPRYKFVWFGILAAYLGLILFQRYHSLLDIAVTLIMILPFIATIFILSKKTKVHE